MARLHGEVYSGRPVPRVVFQGVDNFYSDFEKHSKTIIPARGFFEHDKNVIHVNLSSLRSKPGSAKRSRELKEILLHEAGHYQRGVSEKAAGVYAREHLVGGLADNMPDSLFNEADLKEGAKVESEHTNSPFLAREIAKDHLVEDNDYYRKLRKAGL